MNLVALAKAESGDELTVRTALFRDIEATSEQKYLLRGSYKDHHKSIYNESAA